MSTIDNETCVKQNRNNIVFTASNGVLFHVIIKCFTSYADGIGFLLYNYLQDDETISGLKPQRVRVFGKIFELNNIETYKSWLTQPGALAVPIFL